MKKLLFLVDVLDKNTNEQYTEGQIKEFEDIRADEILRVKRNNGKPYAEEVKETKVEEVKTKSTSKKTTKKEVKK